jgi:acetate kinase
VVCEGLGFLGIRLATEGNNASDQRISQADSPVAVCVFTSEEDRQIARHCRAMLSTTPARSAEEGR